MDARRRFSFLRSDTRASKFGKLIELASSPSVRKTLATVAGSAGYVALGQAGYQPGTETTAGLDAEQVRMMFAAAFAIGGYVLPSGTLSVVKNWANVLGKESANRITSLETRVTAIESRAAATPKPAKDPT